MAAEDNEISPKRRRLFKALSTAPVVMTLQSGSAMATASAFNCLDNKQIKPIETLVPQMVAGDPAYVYEKHPGYRYTGGSCPSVPFGTEGWIVSIDGEFYQFETATNVTNLVAVSTSGGNRLDLKKETIKPGEFEVCATTEPMQEVLLLVVYEPLKTGEDGFTKTPVAGGSGMADDVEEVGVVPLADPNSGFNQGITGSCLMSITGQPLPGNRMLSKG